MPALNWSFIFSPSLTCQPAVDLNTNVILHPNDEMCKHLHRSHFLLYRMTMLASVKSYYASSLVTCDDILSTFDYPEGFWQA